MKVVLLAEKPSAAETMIKAIMSVYPEYKVTDFLLYYRFRFMNLNRMFKFSHGHKFSEYPLVEETQYHDFFTWEDMDTMFKNGHSVALNGDRIRSIAIDDREDSVRVVDCFANAERIYVGFAEDYNGDPHLQLRLRDWLRSHGVNCRDLTLRNWTNYTHADTVEVIKSAEYIADDELVALATPSIIKRYFDFNYLQNSFAVIQKIAQVSLGNPLKHNLKKHELQLLYNIRSEKPRNDGQLIRNMMEWKGTGRYEVNEGSFGGPATQASYIENLVRNGLAIRVPVRRHPDYDGMITNIVISDKGLRFLDWLHPDCEDPDQVFRIDQWSRLPYEEAKEKIDRYLMTFFGRQKRFLIEKMLKEG